MHSYPNKEPDKIKYQLSRLLMEKGNNTKRLIAKEKNNSKKKNVDNSRIDSFPTMKKGILLCRGR